MSKYKSVAAVMLAAGRGTRMKSTLPKVLFTVNKQPIALHGLKTLDSLGLEKIIVVIGYRSALVKKRLGKKWAYVEQRELLGTGHAVSMALPDIPTDCHTLIVVNGDDFAFFHKETVANFLEQHFSSRAKMTIITCIKPGAEISGRVVRDKRGKLVDVVANSELTPEKLAINNEMVCGLYILDRDWLERELPKVKKSQSGEFFITSLIFTALKQKQLQDLVLEDPNQWQSINTQRELRLARHLSPWRSGV